MDPDSSLGRFVGVVSVIRAVFWVSFGMGRRGLGFRARVVWVWESPRLSMNGSSSRGSSNAWFSLN